MVPSRPVPSRSAFLPFHKLDDQAPASFGIAIDLPEHEGRREAFPPKLRPCRRDGISVRRKWKRESFKKTLCSVEFMLYSPIYFTQG